MLFTKLKRSCYKILRYENNKFIYHEKTINNYDTKPCEKYMYNTKMFFFS